MSKEISTVNVFAGVAYTPDQVSQPFGSLPATQGQALKLAEFYAQSGTVPKDYIGRPGNILVAMEFGAEIGLKPLASLQNVAVINGRPSLWGDALLGLVLAHKDNQGVEESFDITTNTATCLVKRKGRKDITWTFSFADATAAGIRNNPVWKNYPRRMAQMRARGFAIRDMWADVLKGLGSAEEQRDIADAKDITSEVELSREQTVGQSSSEKLADELGVTTQADLIEQKLDETKTILDNNQINEIQELFLEISVCTKLSDLTNLIDRCAALPQNAKGSLKTAYAAKQKQLKQSIKQVDKNYKSCTQCSNSADLNTCPSCHNHYCVKHWGLDGDQCKTCIDLGFELDKKASEDD